MKKLLLLILPAVVMSCGSSDAYIDAALDRAEMVMNEHPDSAICIMRSIDRQAVGGASKIARYSLLYSQALDKNHIDIDDDSLVRFAVDYYADHGKPLQKALSYYYLGCVHYNAGDETLAAEALVEAENAVLHTTDYYTCGLIYSLRGNLYYLQYSFEEALTAYRTSAGFYDKAGMSANKGYMLEAQGKVLVLRGNIDEALDIYGKALDIAVESNDMERVLMLNGKIAGVKLFAWYPPDEIKSSLRRLYDRYDITGIPDSDNFIWSTIYLKEGSIDSARHLALSTLDRSNMTAHMKAGNIAILMRMEKQAGNFEKAFEYSNKYIVLQDSIHVRERENLIQKTEQKYNNKLLKSSYEAFRVKHKYQMIIILSAIVIVISTAVAAIRAIITHRHRVIDAKNREIVKYLELLSTVNTNYSELQNKHSELERDFAEDDEKEACFMHALERRLEGLSKLLEYAYIYENKAGVFYDKFKKYIDECRSEENSFSDLQYIVNKKYYGIIDYLKEKHPKLNNDDLDLCSMICFGFSANSIRIIYNHKNLDSVYNKRARLHSKLKISDKLRLDTYIKQILDDLSKGMTSAGM